MASGIASLAGAASRLAAGGSLISKLVQVPKPGTGSLHPFVAYIHRVLKGIHPTVAILPMSARVLTDMIEQLLDSMAKIAVRMVSSQGQSGIISDATMRAAMKTVWCSPEIPKHANREGMKALKLFREGYNPTAPGIAFLPGAVSQAAGLDFSVEWVHRALAGRASGQLITPAAAVYAAAVLQYMTAEILELSGNHACVHHRDVILPRDIALAIWDDEELDAMWGGRRGIFPYAGAHPHAYKSKTPRDMPKPEWYEGNDPLFGRFLGSPEDQAQADDDEPLNEAECALQHHFTAKKHVNLWDNNDPPEEDDDLEDVDLLAGTVLDSSMLLDNDGVTGLIREECEHLVTSMAGDAYSRILRGVPPPRTNEHAMHTIATHGDEDQWGNLEDARESAYYEGSMWIFDRAAAGEEPALDIGTAKIAGLQRLDTPVDLVGVLRKAGAAGAGAAAGPVGSAGPSYTISLGAALHLAGTPLYKDDVAGQQAEGERQGAAGQGQERRAVFPAAPKAVGPLHPVYADTPYDLVSAQSNLVAGMSSDDAYAMALSVIGGAPLPPAPEEALQGDGAEGRAGHGYGHAGAHAGAGAPGLGGPEGGGGAEGAPPSEDTAAMALGLLEGEEDENMEGVPRTRDVLAMVQAAQGHVDAVIAAYGTRANAAARGVVPPAIDTTFPSLATLQQEIGVLWDGKGFRPLGQVDEHAVFVSLLEFLSDCTRKLTTSATSWTTHDRAAGRTLYDVDAKLGMRAGRLVAATRRWAELDPQQQQHPWCAAAALEQKARMDAKQAVAAGAWAGAAGAVAPSPLAWPDFSESFSLRFPPDLEADYMAACMDADDLGPYVLPFAKRVSEDMVDVSLDEGAMGDTESCDGQAQGGMMERLGRAVAALTEKGRRAHLHYAAAEQADSVVNLPADVRASLADAHRRLSEALQLLPKAAYKYPAAVIPSLPVAQARDLLFRVSLYEVVAIYNESAHQELQIRAMVYMDQLAEAEVEAAEQGREVDFGLVHPVEYLHTEEGVDPGPVPRYYASGLPSREMELLIREVTQEFKTDLGWTPDALEALRLAAEDYVVKTLERSNRLAGMANRGMIHPKDIQLARRLANER